MKEKYMNKVIAQVDQLGDGTYSNRSIPTLINEFYGATEISEGRGSGVLTCASMNTGSIKCTGYDYRYRDRGPGSSYSKVVTSF
jgi:hypothetical protein